MFTLLVVVSEIACDVVFWIVPPESATAPLPVTVRPPAPPVLLSTMPLAGSAAAGCCCRRRCSGRKWPRRCPMSVLVTLSAVADVESIVLPVPETTIVPLLLAKMPRPLVVSMSRPPPVRLSV